MPTSAIDSLLANIRDRLAADPGLATVPIVAERQYLEAGAMYEDLLAEALNGYGVAVAIKLPPAKSRFKCTAGPTTKMLTDLNVVTEIWWNPLFAAAPSLSVNQIQEAIVGLLHLWTPDALSCPLAIGEGNHPEATDGFLVVPLNWTATSGITRTLPTVATPALVNVGGTVTITCATAGAALFYTVNGTRPSPRNGTLYLAPITPASPALVKVNGWLAGYVGSATGTL